jgi:hypothetical protein
MRQLNAAHILFFKLHFNIVPLYMARLEASRTFRQGKGRGSVKEKINELERTKILDI